MIRKILSLTVLFFLTSYTLAEPLRYCTAQESSQDPEISYEEAIRRLDLFMQKIEELRSHIDRSQFDLEALLDKIGYEAEDIIRFVKEEIAFEQYPGLLRGAQGTLMSRAGNALDQSVLLATLLKDAGNEARIVEGTISNDAALVLLKQMKPARKEQLPSVDRESFLEKVDEVLSLLGLDSEFRSTFAAAYFDSREADSLAAYSKANASSEMILGRLQQEGFALDNREVTSLLLSEAATHYWVEYRFGPSDRWLEIFPAFSAEIPSGNKLQAARVFSETIPQELQHRLRIQAFLERRRGARTETIPVTHPWERPAANLIGVALTHGVMPLSFMNLSGFSSVEEAISENKFFLPILAGSLAPGSQAFDLDGNTFPPDALAYGAAAFVKEVSEKFSDAVSALRKAGASKATQDPFVLTDFRFDYALVKPGGEEKVIRRSLIDSAFARTGTDTALHGALVSSRSLMIAPGRYPRAYTIDRMLQELLAAKPTLAYALKGLQNPDATISGTAEDVKNLQLTFAAHCQLYSLFDLYESQLAGSIYRSEPSVIVYEERLDADFSQYSGLDILNHSRKSISTRGDGFFENLRDLVRIGVWETEAEGAFLSSSFNTPELFEAALESGIPIVVVSEQEVEKLRDLEVSASVKSLMEREIREGYVLLVPKSSPVADPSVTAWWRVHPTTGVTLGVLSTGQGGALAHYQVTKEYITGLASAGGTLVFAGCAAALVLQEPMGRLEQTARSFGCSLCGLFAAAAIYTFGIYGIWEKLVPLIPSTQKPKYRLSRSPFALATAICLCVVLESTANLKDCIIRTLQ